VVALFNHFRNPTPVSHRLEAGPVEVLWSTDRSLLLTLNPVPSSTFAPEDFPFPGCNPCFQRLPLMPFLTATADFYLRSPLPLDKPWFTKLARSFSSCFGLLWFPDPADLQKEICRFQPFKRSYLASQVYPHVVFTT
jgi:hypothetical protein